VRIVVAEDGGLLRTALLRLLGEIGFEVVGAVGDADSLLDLVATERPDVAIVDIRMPPTYTDEGLRAAATLRAMDSPPAVLVLTQSADPAHATRLLQDGRGGLGYLLKDRVADVEEIGDAIRRVALGGTVIDPSVIAALVTRSRVRDPLATLTAREREVLGLMAEGRSNLGIAERLVVTEKTVETHVASILGKLGLEATPEDHRRVLAVLRYLGRA
jgi:DNA-binding NarL/FixJ family response regulator